MGIPQTSVDPLTEARKLASVFRQGAAERDAEGRSPKAQRDLIRASGLLLLSIPTASGGLGGDWPTLLRATREIATVDGSLAHLFGYHHLGVITPHLIGTSAQRDHWYVETVRRGLFWGNSLNPLDTRTRLLRTGDQTFQLDGEKSFCTGATDSDVLVVSGTEVEEARLHVAVIPTTRDGVRVNDDWDNMGQRLTDSGSVSYRSVVVHADELLGPPGPGGSVWATLRTCVTQSILSNIFLGVAQGALLEARSYTLGLERPFAGSSAARPAEDLYVLEGYGEMHVQLEAAAGLVDRAADALQFAWQREYALSADERGECAVAVSMAKVAAARAALEVTSRVFEVMGSRATSGKYRFDRFWRNVRTLTLHDPLDYKVREVGDWALNGKYPTPSFYS
jgi:alkylation response protein AidB-like acyl-CoA dehydrogenase